MLLLSPFRLYPRIAAVTPSHRTAPSNYFPGLFSPPAPVLPASISSPPPRPFSALLPLFSSIPALVAEQRNEYAGGSSCAGSLFELTRKGFSQSGGLDPLLSEPILQLFWQQNPIRVPLVGSNRDCDLPKFDPKKFLNKMRHKSLAFIGDSIMRNHADTFEDENGVSKGLIKLHLDNLDIVWMEQHKDLDYVIIAGGK
ncbi:hypothetical protein ACS0TY_025888 [Phlomoides rotata]